MTKLIWGVVMAAAMMGCAKEVPAKAAVQVAATGASRDPDGFRFETSDIARFWAMYDQLATSREPEALVQRAYLDQGSPGLRAFTRLRIKSAAKLLAVITAHPKYFAAIRANTQQVATLEAKIRGALREMKVLYPEATFPSLYFVIGAMSSGGTVSDDGLLIGTEMFSRGPDVPSDELSPWLQAVTRSIEELPLIVVHEWVHSQQQHGAESLLAQVVQEGSADFLAELVTHGTINEHVYKYGYAHEAALKRELLEDFKTNAAQNWLYNAEQSKDRPADLGYFMGYRIAQAYYQRAADKRRAIYDILHIADYERFLADSGYFAATAPSAAVTAPAPAPTAPAPAPTATSAAAPHGRTS